MGAKAAPPPLAVYRKIPGGFEAEVPLRSWRGLITIPHAGIASALAAGVIDVPEFTIIHHIVAGLIASIGWGWAALLLFGRMRVRREWREGTIRWEVASRGWTQRFRWTPEITAAEAPSRGGFSFELQPGQVIALTPEAEFPSRQVRFGSLLRKQWRQFLLAVIREEIEADNRRIHDS